MLLLLALSISVVTTATSRSDFTPGGLYVVHRDEVPPYTVTIRQVGINISELETIGMLSEWSITLGPGAEQLQVLQFGAVDTKTHVLISKFCQFHQREGPVKQPLYKTALIEKSCAVVIYLSSILL